MSNRLWILAYKVHMTDSKDAMPRTFTLLQSADLLASRF